MKLIEFFFSASFAMSSSHWPIYRFWVTNLNGDKQAKWIFYVFLNPKLETQKRELSLSALLLNSNETFSGCRAKAKEREKEQITTSRVGETWNNSIFIKNFELHMRRVWTLASSSSFVVSQKRQETQSSAHNKGTIMSINQLYSLALRKLASVSLFLSRSYFSPFVFACIKK